MLVTSITRTWHVVDGRTGKHDILALCFQRISISIQNVSAECQYQNSAAWTWYDISGKTEDAVFIYVLRIDRHAEILMSGPVRRVRGLEI